MADITGEKFRKLTPKQKEEERAKVAAQKPTLPSGPAKESVDYGPITGPKSPDARTPGLKGPSPKDPNYGFRITKPHEAAVASGGTFDPRRRGGWGLAGPAGSPKNPLEAKTLREATDMINQEAEDGYTSDTAAPTEDVPTPVTTPTDTPETPTDGTTPEPTFLERQKAIADELQRQKDALENEPISQGQANKEIAILEAQAAKDLQALNWEQKLEAEAASKEDDAYDAAQLQAQKDWVYDYMDKTGNDINVAISAYKNYVSATAKLDPVDKATYDSIIAKYRTEGFNAQDAFDVAIDEYAADGYDITDMGKAYDAVKSVYGQGAADQLQDDYSVNRLGIDRDIVEGNRKYTQAKRFGESIKMGMSRTTGEVNMYLDAIEGYAPELVMRAAADIIASPYATKEAKAAARAKQADYMSTNKLTEAELKAQYLSGQMEDPSGFLSRMAAMQNIGKESEPLTESQLKAKFLAGGFSNKEAEDEFITRLQRLEDDGSIDAGSAAVMQRLSANPSLFSSLSQSLKDDAILAGFEPPAGARLSEQGLVNLETTILKDYKTGTEEERAARRQLGIMEASYKKAQEAMKSGESINAASQGVLVTFQKILDPTSVVRESEYARSGSGQSLADKWDGLLTQLKQGGANVTVDTLGEFMETSRSFMKGYEKSMLDSRKYALNRANKYGIDINGFLPDGELQALTDDMNANGEVVATANQMTIEDVDAILLDPAATREQTQMALDALDLLGSQETSYEALKQAGDTFPLEASAQEYFDNVIKTVNDLQKITDPPVGRRQCGAFVNDALHLEGVYRMADDLESKKDAPGFLERPEGEHGTPMLGGYFVMDTGTDYGHVGLVTGVDSNGIYITDTNYDNKEGFRKNTFIPYYDENGQMSEEYKKIVGFGRAPLK